MTRKELNTLIDFVDELRLINNYEINLTIDIHSKEDKAILVIELDKELFHMLSNKITNEK
jgi:hypothetical protein